jgi:hypothetical protein
MLETYELSQKVQCSWPSEPLAESRTHFNVQLSSPPLSGAIAYVRSGASRRMKVVKRRCSIHPLQTFGDMGMMICLN